MTFSLSPKKLGLIINPIAGMGGSCGLKGTDGRDILEKAISLGSTPNANERTKEFLKNLVALKEKLLIFTPPDIMGENICKELGFNIELINNHVFQHQIKLYETTRNDSIKAAKYIKNIGCDLLIFVGGDGTARDILEAVNQDIPCLGIPGGVKIHSSVFTTNPITAAKLTMEFLWGESPVRESEVMDIDEEEFRNNRVVSKLYGYLLTPYSPIYLQASKMSTPYTVEENDNKKSISKWILEEMDMDVSDTYYLIGPGSTTKPICDLINQKKTLLGVDLMYKKSIIATDLNENEILNHLKQHKNCKTKLIVTPIGNQGFVFGRGNLQLSWKVLEIIGVSNIIIICTKYKFSTLPDGKLRIDTRNLNMDRKFQGMYRVLVDYGEFRIVEML